MSSPWTAEQVRAITAADDALLVANAGTGKTTTVVARILWMLGLDIGPDENGDAVPPCPRPCELRDIAAITFTEKAAHDLKEKLRREIAKAEGGDALRWQIDRASVGTIHAFCAALLREHALRLGIDSTFGVLEEREARVEQERALRDAIVRMLEEGDAAVARFAEEHSLYGFGYQAGSIDLARAAFRDLRWHRARYERWLSDGQLSLPVLRELCADWSEPDDVRAEHCAALIRIAARALETWTAFEEEQNVRDFDSLVLDARERLLSPEGGAALEALRRRYRILIIDEFQDTDFAQRDIAFAIAGRAGGRKVKPDAPQLFLVGDPKQSIYGFRGADISVWNAVQDELAPPLALTRNFRSEPAIIDFVNAFGADAMGRVALALTGDLEHERIGYSNLVAARPAAGGAVEWLVPPDTSHENPRRKSEGVLLVDRIREMMATLTITDRDDETPRPLEYRDIAILYRSRTGLEHYEAELRRNGVPYYLTGQAGLTDRQEVADLVNALRAVNNPMDELALFGFLRSPFVGLRDETLVRLRFSGGGSLLTQARRFLADPERVSPAPVDVVENESLKRGLETLAWAEKIAHRIPLDDLLRELIRRTGYREHLVFFDGDREAFANIESFLRLAEDHRDATLDTFLAIWDRWDEADAGLPQAPLYSTEDNVVTVSTFHSAKGLEWPVVFLIDTASKFREKNRVEFWTDPHLGPAMPVAKRVERGARDVRAVERRIARARAEDVRLAYVAATRAMHRLVVLAPIGQENCYAEWLDIGRRKLGIEARTGVPSTRTGSPRPAVDLAWMSAIDRTSAPRRLSALTVPRMRYISSATERMLHERRPDEWLARYVHGVEPAWDFGRDDTERVPATVRGTIIHSVLERIQAREELARILDETIGEVDAPELQPLLAPGSEYYRGIAQEIDRVLEHPEWRAYTAGEHYRELEFLFRADDFEWLVGAFDLYRPDAGGAGGARGLIVDFKTHVIGAGETTTKARDYTIQAEIYAQVARELRGDVEVRLHFTHPNRIVDMASIVAEARARRESAGRSTDAPEQTDLFA